MPRRRFYNHKIKYDKPERTRIRVSGSLDIEINYYNAINKSITDSKVIGIPVLIDIITIYSIEICILCGRVGIFDNNECIACSITQDDCDNSITKIEDDKIVEKYPCMIENCYEEIADVIIFHHHNNNYLAILCYCHSSTYNKELTGKKCRECNGEFNNADYIIYEKNTISYICDEGKFYSDSDWSYYAPENSIIVKYIRTTSMQLKSTAIKYMYRNTLLWLE